MRPSTNLVRNYEDSPKLQQSSSKAITLHNQSCLLNTGQAVVCSLKLFIKDGVQYARAVGRRFGTLRKRGGYWIQDN